MAALSNRCCIAGCRVGAHGKTGLWRQQHDVRGWAVHQQIDHPGGQHQLIQRRGKARGKRPRADQLANHDAFGIDETLDDRGIPGGHDERGVDIAGDQPRGRHFRAVSPKNSPTMLSILVVLMSSSASARAPLPSGPIDTRRPRNALHTSANVTSVEEPQRLVKYRAQRCQALAIPSLVVVPPCMKRNAYARTLGSRSRARFSSTAGCRTEAAARRRIAPGFHGNGHPARNRRLPSAPVAIMIVRGGNVSHDETARNQEDHNRASEVGPIASRDHRMRFPIGITGA